MALDSTGMFIVAAVSLFVLLVVMIVVVIAMVKSGSGKVTEMPGAKKRRKRSLGLDNAPDYIGDDEGEDNTADRCGGELSPHSVNEDDNDPRISVQESSFTEPTRKSSQNHQQASGSGERRTSVNNGSGGGGAANPFSSLDAADTSGGGGGGARTRSGSGRGGKSSRRSNSPSVDKYSNDSSIRSPGDNNTPTTLSLGQHNAGDLTVESFNSVQVDGGGNAREGGDSDKNLSD